MFRGSGAVPVTVGLDIGTTSVKAVSVDDDGTVLAQARVPHRIVVPAPDRMEHDASKAWRRGPVRALSKLGATDAAAVAVAAMVPSMTAVDGRGRPVSPGLLYGDGRGRSAKSNAAGPEGGAEVMGFLRWSTGAVPSASGYWPAQAVANRALGGAPAVDLGVAFTSIPLYGTDGWDAELCAECGARPEQLPDVEMTGAPVGKVDGDGAVLTAGTVDVWCEQLVAGADSPGDVHVICGTTLIVWAPVTDAPSAPGLWTVAHTRPGMHMVGGASNAGGLFLDWASRLGGRSVNGDALDPSNIPVWTPYPRGERTPYHDPDMRAGLHRLDLTHGPAALRRSAWEASGFVVRHHVDLAGVKPARIVATGGGTLVEGWMQALADATGVPVHVAESPYGAARGAAFLARLAGGIEIDVREAARWARTGRIVDPDPRWVERTADRYRLFVELSGSPA
jgi:xylulokinase